MSNSTATDDRGGGEKRQPSRREFLRQATGGVAAAAAVPWLGSKALTSRPEKAKRTTDMTFLNFFTGVDATAFKHLATMFEQENPHIKWTGILVPYNNLEAKYLTLAAGGQVPDGTLLSNLIMPGVAARHLLADLGPYIKRDHFDLKHFYPARLKSGQYQGKQYGMPIDNNSSAVYFNQDAFDQAGLKYPDATWSYEDYRSAAAKLTFDSSGRTPDHPDFDPGHVRQYGMSWDTSTYRYYYMYTGLNGAQYFDKKVSKLELGEEKGQASLTWWQNLIKKDRVAPSAAVANSLSNGGQIVPFASGVYAMSFIDIETAAMHAPGAKIKRYDVAPFPKTPTAKYEVGGQTFVVSQGAKHPDAAWAWAKFMTTERAWKYFAPHSSGWVPAQRRFAQFAVDPRAEHFVEAFFDPIASRGLAEWWFTPEWTQWQDTMDSDLTTLFSDLKTPRQTADAIQQSIGSAVATWRQSQAGSGG